MKKVKEEKNSDESHSISSSESDMPKNPRYNRLHCDFDMEEDSFVQKFIDYIWKILDGDKSNELDKNKTIQFMKTMLN